MISFAQEEENTDTAFKVFIVDDSIIIVDRLKAMLSDFRFVSVAGHSHNIADALRVIREIRPDVIILDIHLKDDAPMGGLDLLEILHREYAAMIIIMLSNFSSPKYIERCRELGADYFLDKSNDFDKIPVILKQLYESI